MEQSGIFLTRWKQRGVTEYISVPQWRGPIPIVSDPRTVRWGQQQQWNQMIKEWHRARAHARTRFQVRVQFNRHR